MPAWAAPSGSSFATALVGGANTLIDVLMLNVLLWQLSHEQCAGAGGLQFRRL